MCQRFLRPAFDFRYLIIWFLLKKMDSNEGHAPLDLDLFLRQCAILFMHLCKTMCQYGHKHRDRDRLSL